MPGTPPPPEPATTARVPPPSPPTRTVCVGDVGTGLIGTIASITVFLVFLLFAVQLLVGLYGRSVVTSVAYDGARSVAGHRSSHDRAAELQAEDRMRQQVGSAMRLAFDWSAGTDTEVVLRVQADNPRLLGLGLSGVLATDHIDRTVHVRIEREQ